MEEARKTITVEGLGTITGTVKELHDLWMIINHASVYEWKMNVECEENGEECAYLWERESSIANHMCCEITKQVPEVLKCVSGDF